MPIGRQAMRQDFKKLFEFLLGIPLTIVSFYFIFNFIYRNREEILPVFSDFNIAPYLLGLFFLTIFFSNLAENIAKSIVG